MVTIDFQTFDKFTEFQKVQIKKLIKYLTISDEDYEKSIIENKHVFFVSNERKDILACLFVQDDSEILFLRVKDTHRQYGYSKILLVYVMSLLDDLHLFSSNKYIYDFLTRNNFELVEKDVISKLSSNIGCKFVQKQKNRL